MPKLKGISFETAIIERYRRRESSVEEALIEMYLAGVSVRRVEDITEALWGSKVSPSAISELNKKAYVHIEDWRNRPLQGGRYPYVYSAQKKRSCVAPLPEVLLMRERMRSNLFSPLIRFLTMM